MPIGVCTDVILKVGNFPISGDWASGMTVDIRWSLCIHSEPSLMEDIGNKVSFAAFAAHLWKLAGLHCWLHGQCGIHCSLGRTGAWVANQAMNKGEWVYHTNRARASRVMEVSKGVEGYKEKGEPIGTTPDRLAVTAVDCVSSWNSFCLTFLFSRLSTFCLMMHDDATFSWCRLPLQPFLLPAVCLDVFSPWHFFLSTSFSDGATFSPSGLRWSSPLNHDSPYCWQLWSPRPDTLFSPDKLLSPHSWLSYLFISPLSSFPYSFHVPSLSVLYSFQPSLHFPILCTFSRHPYLWASLFLETFFSSLLSTSHSLDAVFAWHHFSSFLLLHCFILLFWDLFLLKLFHLTPSVLTSPLSWSHLSRLFLLTFSYLANKN